MAVVHGTDDEIVRPSHTERLLQVAAQHDVKIEAWRPKGVGHVGALAVHPQEYERRMAEFFIPEDPTGP